MQFEYPLLRVDAVSQEFVFIHLYNQGSKNKRVKFHFNASSTERQGRKMAFLLTKTMLKQ